MNAPKEFGRWPVLACVLVSEVSCGSWESSFAVQRTHDQQSSKSCARSETVGEVSLRERDTSLRRDCRLVANRS